MQNKLDKAIAALDDKQLLERLHEVEKTFDFYQKDHAVACYVPVDPILITLPFDQLMREFKKSVLRGCNTVYANCFRCKKEDLINKVTLEELIPNNFVNLALLKRVIENKFHAEGGESLQYDKEGHEKWFLNSICCEIKDDFIVGIWVRKREITHEKTMAKHFVEGLLAMLENRDAYTVNHQKRVTNLVKRIGIEYGLTPDKMAWLELGGMVHDIGKIAIPIEILSKPISLTPIEKTLVKLHPEVGYKILKNFDELGYVPEIVYQHHERLDGSGYPRGLKGDEILVETKILAVADVMESMSTHRPYRPAYSIEETLNEIKKQRGVKLDPKAVDICVSLFENKQFSF